METILVKVPATSANVGSGFDAAGLALGLYNTAEFSPASQLTITAADGTAVPTGTDNLVYQAFAYLFAQAGQPVPPVRIVQTNPIPMARGLGSSSACIVAGLLGANRMLGDRYDKNQLLDFATKLEGHPDNVAPALLGGFVRCICDEGRVYALRSPLDESLCFAAVIPDYPLLTTDARAVLPAQVPYQDAVFNLSRAALLQDALCGGHPELLPLVTQDRLHQPYRLKRMPGSDTVFAAAKQLGALAVYLSGAGSTILVVMHRDKADAICAGLAEALGNDPACRGFVCKRLPGDDAGAQVL